VNIDPVLKAASYAARRHHGQMRKDKETPYFAHPVRVMLNVLREFGETDPDTLCAALLHDTIEDTTTDWDDIAREFNPTVAGYVATLTKDKRLEEHVREERYFEAVAGAPRAVRLCKIADTLDNLRDLPTGGDRKKTVAKAQKLLAIYGEDADPGVQKALGCLRREVEAGERCV